MRYLDLLEMRAIAYKYASKLVDYPYDEDIEKMRDMLADFVAVLGRLEQLEAKYSGVVEVASGAAAMLLSELNELGRDEFQAEYVSTFELGSPKPLCPPYENEYVGPGELKESNVFIDALNTTSPQFMDVKHSLDVLATVSIFYETYGVQVSQTTPDHLVVELEFMYYLTAKEYEALKNEKPKDARMYRKAQAEFIENHLSRWMEKLANCVREKGSLKGYGELISSVGLYTTKDHDVIKKYIELEPHV